MSKLRLCELLAPILGAGKMQHNSHGNFERTRQAGLPSGHVPIVILLVEEYAGHARWHRQGEKLY